MATTLAELLDEVVDSNTVQDSAIALLDNLKLMLDNAAALNADKIRAEVQNISALIATQKQEIVDGMLRNTPAAPTP